MTASSTNGSRAPSPGGPLGERLVPLAALPAAAARGCVGILSDIDDTLTSSLAEPFGSGRLVPEAVAALYEARRAGLRVMLVTGRPGGWAEVLARLLPVDAAVGEGGACAFFPDGSARYWDPPEVRREQRVRLDALAADLMARLPFARLADDSALRKVDLAFDIGERQHLGEPEIARIVDGIRAHGVEALVSTVHAHAVPSDYDKVRMALRLARELWDMDEQAATARLCYVGDSPNDQAGFRAFPLSVGVANVRRYAARLDPPPAFVTDGEAGHGAAELVRHLLAARR